MVTDNTTEQFDTNDTMTPGTPAVDTPALDTPAVDTPVVQPVAEEAATPEQQAPEQQAPEQQAPLGSPVNSGQQPGTAGNQGFPQQQPPTQQQFDQMAQQAAQLQQVQAQTAMQNQANTYKQQLEAQGYLPEHAEQAANYYMQTQQQQQQLMQQADQYGQHIQMKQLAAESMAQKYKLNLSDLAELRKYDDPNSMDQAARKLASDKQRDAELAQLKQSRVPTQEVDNSQGNPTVAADEGSWLDRYNGGDRSSEAVSAARRAAGQ